MPKLPISLFVNPVAGRGRAARSIDLLRNLLYANDVDHELVVSDEAGDIERQVFQRAAAGARQILVAGGDGSIHEAVNGLMLSGGDTALGVIPIGTGNDFAKACTIPPYWEDAVVLLADRINSDTPDRFIDVGQMNDRFFANGAGIGFDAKVTRIAEGIRLPIGDLVYLLAVFRAMLDGVTTPELRIDYGNESYAGPLVLASISNGDWVGGMFNIAPMARNDDGELDLVFAKPVGSLRMMNLLPRLLQGTHLDQPEIVHKPVKRCEIVSTAPVPSQLDGELQPMYSEFSIRVIENGLRLI